MSEKIVETAIELMGRSYQVKCKEEELPSLMEARDYLENAMYSLRAKNNLLSQESMAVITALNVIHDFLKLQNTVQIAKQSLLEMQQKIETTLS